MEQLGELFTFLQPDARSNVKSVALSYLLGLTGSEEGRALVTQQGDVVYPLLLDLINDKVHEVSRDALLTLLNLSAFETAANCLVKLGIIPRLLNLVVDHSNQHADTSCMLLSNLTRQEVGALALTEILMVEGKPDILQLVDIFNQKGYNEHAQFHYLATVFSNITQVASARHLFLDRSKMLLPRLLPFVQFQESLTRRGGVAGLLRNLCFEVGRFFLSYLSSSLELSFSLSLSHTHTHTQPLISGY